jgi:hypothetical protein
MLDNMEMSWQEEVGDLKFTVIEFRLSFLYQLYLFGTYVFGYLLLHSEQQEKWKERVHFRYAFKTSTIFH